MKNEPESRNVVCDDEADGAPEPEFKRLNADEAAEWRSRQPRESVWNLVLWQLLLGVLLVPLAWLLTRRIEVAVSVAYGVSCILLPTALMAYGLTSSGLARLTQRLFPGVSGLSLAGLFFWEGVKVLLALAMMWLAPRMVPGLSWLALVAGLVVALKAYWLELWMRSRRASRTSKIL
jgi:ATP synthase protein I